MSGMIYKWKLKKAQIQRIEMPQGTKLLTVQMQDHEVCLWGVIDNLQPMTQRQISMIGTGWGPYPDRVMENYIGTVQEGALVWHFFAEEDEKYQFTNFCKEEMKDPDFEHWQRGDYAELLEASSIVLNNEDHAFSSGARKYAKGSNTWDAYENLRSAIAKAKEQL